MNIFNKITVQGMKKSRTRTVVTIIGVILSAAMITAIATFGVSLLNYLTNGSIAKYGNWHARFVDVDSSFVQEQEKDKEVTDTAVIENVGYAMLGGAKTPDKPYLFISGFRDETFDSLPITLISGRLPETSSEVLVPSHIAIKAGVHISLGDTLILTVGNRDAGGLKLTQHDAYRAGEERLVSGVERTYTVVGICERPGFEEQLAPGYTLITKADRAISADSLDLFVTLDHPRRVNDYVSRAAESGSYELNEDVLRFMGVSENTIFNTLLYSVGGILVTIIMIGSVFLIYNSFNISMNERTHQFGILMSVGAASKQLRNSVLFEGLCIGAAGIPIGVLAGIGCVKLLLPIVANNFSTILSSNTPLSLSVSIPVLAAAAAVSLITILISAYIPARKAAAAPVMECIRQTNVVKTEPKAVKTSRLVERICGLEGMLALKNFKRNKKRYRSIILSLTLSVVLFVSANAFGSALKQLSKEYTVEMDGDLIFETQDMEQNELFDLYEKMREVDSVYDSTYQANLTCPAVTADLPADFRSIYREWAGDESKAEMLELPLDVQFIEDDIYYDFIESLGLPSAEYTGSDAKVLMVGMNTVEHTTYFTGSSMDFTVSSASGEQEKTICAFFVDSYPLDILGKERTPEYYFLVVVPWQMKPQFDILDAPERQGLTFWSENPARSMTLMQLVIEEAGIFSDYHLLNLSSVVDQFRSLTFVVDVFTYVFVTMISLIAVANVFNTISTNIKLRRRELAMLRSVGMAEGDFNKMMSFECVFYGLRTLIFGVPIAGILSWLIYKIAAYGEQMDNFAFKFPWNSMLISILGVFGIVFITMVYAVNKIKKENIIDVLRDDIG